MAAAVTLSYLHEGLPFNMGWWGFTFPLGVFTFATLNLGIQTSMGFFTDIGGFLVIVLVGFWVIVSVRTLIGGYRGHLFVAPCLATGKMLSRETGLNTWPG